MYFKGIFKKKLSIKQGEELLTEYCTVNGFDDIKSQWKRSKHSKHLLAYRKKSNRLISKNWVSYHPTRMNEKYSVWIDLVSKEITEILRKSA
jgi:hypothetical protein